MPLQTLHNTALVSTPTLSQRSPLPTPARSSSSLSNRWAITRPLILRRNHDTRSLVVDLVHAKVLLLTSYFASQSPQSSASEKRQKWLVPKQAPTWPHTASRSDGLASTTSSLCQPSASNSPMASHHSSRTTLMSDWTNLIRSSIGPSSRKRSHLASMISLRGTCIREVDGPPLSLLLHLAETI